MKIKTFKFEFFKTPQYPRTYGTFQSPSCGLWKCTVFMNLQYLQKDLCARQEILSEGI